MAVVPRGREAAEDVVGAPGPARARRKSGEAASKDRLWVWVLVVARRAQRAASGKGGDGDEGDGYKAHPMASANHAGEYDTKDGGGVTGRDRTGPTIASRAC
jgi:hypothetical protein